MAESAGTWTLVDGAVGMVELERMVSAPGNLGLCGQQIWFGPTPAGAVVTLRIKVHRLHVLIGGARHKTLPSKLTARDLRGHPYPSPTSHVGGRGS